MCKYSINAEKFRKMFLAGAANLEANKEWINELNVFPVPDGDTGTNMTLTIQSAVSEVNEIGELSMKTLAKAISGGSLRGARGNSGVILSQLLRGFTKEIRDFDNLDKVLIVAAMHRAVETAYKAVMKPKEGTILTVARGFCEKACELFEENPDIELEELLTRAVAYAAEVLDQTPEMLPVLKEAGVVDSGGEGLLQILQGALNRFTGKVTDEVSEEKKAEPEIPYAYQADFTIVPADGFTKENEQSFASFLSMTGELRSMNFSRGRVMVSTYTDDPGHVLSAATGFGPVLSISIVNLKLDAKKEERRSASAAPAAAPEEPAQSEAAQEEPKKKAGFVAVSIGEGLAQIFTELGVDRLIEGGQTMNPSTQDVINAIQSVNAETVFVFPNNKNIILAASQAQSLVKDRKVIVIPSKTIPQGISALVCYMEDLSVEENEQAMFEAIKAVRTGQITYAVRDTHVDEKEIHKGDYMGMGDHGILAVGTDLTDTVLSTIEGMMSDEAEVISIYRGRDALEADAELLREKIAERWPDCEVELNEGGQPVYYYIISVE